MRESKRSLARALIAKKAFRMMTVIDSRLAVIEMWRRNPLGASVFEFYCPPAFINQFMVRLTSQRQPVDVRLAAAGPVVVVMNFGPVSGYFASRGGADVVRRDR